MPTIGALTAWPLVLSIIAILGAAEEIILGLPCALPLLVVAVWFTVVGVGRWIGWARDLRATPDRTRRLLLDLTAIAAGVATVLAAAAWLFAGITSAAARNEPTGDDEAPAMTAEQLWQAGVGYATPPTAAVVVLLLTWLALWVLVPPRPGRDRTP